MTIFEEAAKRYITCPSICTVQERVENTCRRDGFYEGAKWMQKQAESFITDYLFKNYRADYIDREDAIAKFREIFDAKHKDNIVNY